MSPGLGYALVNKHKHTTLSSPARTKRREEKTWSRTLFLPLAGAFFLLPTGRAGNNATMIPVKPAYRGSLAVFSCTDFFSGRPDRKGTGLHLTCHTSPAVSFCEDGDSKRMSSWWCGFRPSSCGLLLFSFRTWSAVPLLMVPVLSRARLTTRGIVRPSGPQPSILFCRY